MGTVSGECVMTADASCPCPRCHFTAIEHAAKANGTLVTTRAPFAPSPRCPMCRGYAVAAIAVDVPVEVFVHPKDVPAHERTADAYLVARYASLPIVCTGGANAF